MGKATSSEHALALFPEVSYASQMSDIVALLELGSNAVRCLIASVTRGVGFQVLYEEREQTRLGAGRPGTLSPLAINASVKAVRRFLATVRQEYQPAIIAVATAAVREATNRRQLLDKLRREEGIEVQVLSGEEEGRLSALAAIRSLSFRNGAVADLGGGSLQLSHVRDGEVGRVASLPLGAVRTTQMFFASDPPPPQAVSTLRKEVQRQCTPVLPQAKKGHELVGLGGTIRTLARMHLTELQMQRSRQGFRLERAAVTTLRERMERLSTSARSRLPGLNVERADIILAGAVVVEETLRLSDYPAITVCTGGVRHGLLLRETFNGGR